MKPNYVLAGLLVGVLSLTGCQTYAGEMLTRFDVAEDHTRFVFAPQPVHENGMPAYGNPFVTQGYIYPAGTLAGNVTGVNKDGSPAFPDKVLGTWTCDGWFVGEGGNTETGVWLVSRQIYEFADGDVLITQGTEIADIDKSNARPITGGTGDYADVDGVMMQRLLGFNEHMGVNASFEIVDPERQSSFAPIYRPDEEEEDLFRAD